MAITGGIFDVRRDLLFTRRYVIEIDALREHVRPRVGGVGAQVVRAHVVVRTRAATCG